MDAKILKHDIFTEECIFSETAEVSVDTDFTLPDYYGEIKKILKCKAVPRIASKAINSDELIIDGATEINFIYIDGDNKICSYTYLIPFNKVLELKNESQGANILVSAKTSYMNCRALSVRKVDVHGAICLETKVLKIGKEEVVCDADGGGVEVLRETIPATVPIGVGEKNLFIEEDFALGEGQEDIGVILRYDATPRVEECKIIGNKAKVLGKIRIMALYLATNGTKTEQIEKIIPFSQILDIDNVNEDCECDCKVEIAFCELKQRSMGEEENRSLLFTAKLNVTINAFCNNDLPVIKDAYSVSCNLLPQSKTIHFKKIEEKITETFYAKKTLEFSDGEIGSIVDIWCDVNANSYKIENKTLTLLGTVTVSGIIRDIEGTYNYYERPVDFEYKYTLTSNLSNPSANLSVSIANTAYTITSATSVEVKLELVVSAAIYEHKDITLITDICLEEKTGDNSSEQSGVVIYFPEAKESLWEIAKKYNSGVAEIKELNLLTEDEITTIKGILIPVKQ